MESHESTSARPRFSCSGSPLGVVSTTPIPSNQNGPSMALTASCPFEASRPHPVGPLGPADNIPIDGMPEANGSLPKSRKFSKESNIGQRSYRVWRQLQYRAGHRFDWFVRQVAVGSAWQEAGLAWRGGQPRRPSCVRDDRGSKPLLIAIR